MRRDQTERARQRGPKIGKLSSISRLGEEIGRLYRHMRRGELDPSNGIKMVQALMAMKTCYEAAEIEQRLDDLEAAVARGAPTVPWKPKIVS